MRVVFADIRVETRLLYNLNSHAGVKYPPDVSKSAACRWNYCYLSDPGAANYCKHRFPVDPFSGEHAHQIVHAADGTAVDRGDDVTFLQAGFRRRSIRLDRAQPHGRTARHLRHQCGAARQHDRVGRDANEGAAHAAEADDFAQ